MFLPHKTHFELPSHTLSFEFGDPFPGQAVEEQFLLTKIIGLWPEGIINGKNVVSEARLMGRIIV